jgi:hypothetical protein
MLIALVAVVGFAGAWMTVLRPKADAGGDRATAAPAASASGPSAAAPGVGGLGRAVDRARGASAASDAANAAVDKASAAVADSAPKAAAKPAPAPAAKPVAAKPAAARPVASRPPVARHRPAAFSGRTVLLFAGSGADDAVARRIVRSVRRPGVRVIVAGLGEVHRYAHLLGSVSIGASPTILVFGAQRHAQRIDGLPDVGQVEQALAAAR